MQIVNTEVSELGVNIPLALSVIGIILSVIATAVSSTLLFRQIGFQRHGNQMPIIVNLAQEYRTAEFQASQDYVRNILGEQHDHSTGVSGLPFEARNHILRVSALFTSLGILVVHGMAEEKLIVSLLGYQIDKTWKSLAPYIAQERQLRGDSDYLNYYEDLVVRIRSNWPPEESYGFNLGKLDMLTEVR